MSEPAYDVFKVCADCGVERGACVCPEFVQRTEDDRVCQRFLGRHATPVPPEWMVVGSKLGGRLYTLWASSTRSLVLGTARYCAHLDRRHGADGRCLVAGCPCHELQLPPYLWGVIALADGWNHTGQALMWLEDPPGQRWETSSEAVAKAKADECSNASKGVFRAERSRCPSQVWVRARRGPQP